MNTIGNQFFENHPDKVLGEFSIAPYMNKIIVKGSKQDVENYFGKQSTSTQKPEPKDFIKEHIIIGTVPKPESVKSSQKNTEMINKKMKFPKHYKAQDGKYGSGKKETATTAEEKAPNVEKEIIHVEGFKVRSIEDNVKLYTPHLSDNDIKAFVWYNQTLGIPMTGWDKWFLKGANDNTIRATDDVEYLNQQFVSIGKFQKGDVIGKTTKFTHKYNGIDYQVCRKVDGQLVVIDKSKISKSTGGAINPAELKALVISGSLYYLNGDYFPLHVYSNTDYEILKTSLEADKAFIIKEFGQPIYDSYVKLIHTNLMRVDAPKFEDRFKLNPYSEIARTTNAGVLNSEPNEDEEETTQISVSDAFRNWVEDLKNSDFHLVSKMEFRRIIIYDQRERFSKDQEEEKEAYKGTIANAQIECVRLFSNFCADVLDTPTKTTLNRLINLTYNRSMLVNTSKVPVGFISSNKFKNSAFELMPVQVEAFKFAVSRNNFCLALTVGFGKTSVAISLLSYYVSSGALKKPLIVVPKPVLSNWIKEMNGFWINPETKQIAFKETKGFTRQYGILTDCGFDLINIRNLDKKHRGLAPEISKKKVCLTLSTYEALEKMYIGNEEIKTFVINEWKTILSGERQETAREWSKKMGDLEGKLNEVDQNAQIDITELGFDGLFVDEAHRLKNMFVGVTADTTNKISSSFKGSSSSRALRGFYISMYIQKINGRIGFLTATPFSNTPLEVYTMLCFLGYSELTKNNVNKITKFVDLFFNETVEPKVNKDNKIVYEAVMKNYKNKPILNTLLSNTFLYKDDPKEAGLKRPCIIRYPNNDFKLMLKMSPIQTLQRDMLVGNFEKVYDFIKSEPDPELRAYAEEMMFKFQANIASKQGKSRGGSLVASSKISALSPFASSPVSAHFVTDERWKELYYHSPKIRFTVDCISNMMHYHKDREEANSSFLIYCEVGLNILPYFKEALEEMCGFKRAISVNEEEDDDKDIFDEVEIIEGTASSDAEANRRDKVQTLFNMGKVKVIIGTSTIKEGLNLQTNCATLFILTPSWNSTDINQVEGRVHRQGNRFGYARVITPVVARSMDSFIYQKYDEKKSRISDIWLRDGKGDTEDLNIDIPANKQKELILDNAKEIARIRGDMQARSKTNLLNKAKEDYESIKGAISKSAKYGELSGYCLNLTGDMVKVVKHNQKLIKALIGLIKTTEPDKVASSIRNSKSRLETLQLYYSELLEAVEKADNSKEAVDLVNVLSRSYNVRNYYITENYDAKLDFKEFFIDNGYKRAEIENLFAVDIFEKIGIYTKLDVNSPLFETSLKKLKELYSSSVMAEKLLSAEGLSLTSRIEDLDALVERYKGVMDSINTDIEVNFEKLGPDELLKARPEYVEKLTIEAQKELDEENKHSVRSEELGGIFSMKTNPQLSYLANDIDLEKCEIHYDECCDTNGPHETVETKIIRENDPASKIDDTDKFVAISVEARKFLPDNQYMVIKTSKELNGVRNDLNNLVASLPGTYQTEGLQTNDKIAQLHYFRGESDWYIIEKDSEPQQLQAFGYVILNGDDQNAEFGYINIEDVKKYAELDLYWTPVKMGTLLSAEETPASDISKDPDVNKMEVLKTRLKLLKKMVEKKPSATLKTRIKIVEKMLNKVAFGEEFMASEDKGALKQYPETYDESKYTFYSDAGHGWLQVPKKELKELGIENKISGFSYERGDYVYLEEDMDASTYLNAVREQNALGEDYKFSGFRQVDHGNNSAIRNYASYKAKKFEAGGKTGCGCKHELRAAKGTKIEVSSLETLPGKMVNTYILGVKTPTANRITSATITPERFEHRNVTLTFAGGGEESFPLRDYAKFISGKEVTIKDGKGEPYILQLIS